MINFSHGKNELVFVAYAEYLMMIVFNLDT